MSHARCSIPTHAFTRIRSMTALMHAPLITQFPFLLQTAHPRVFALAIRLDHTARLLENFEQHLERQLASEGVLLARVIRGDQLDIVTWETIGSAGGAVTPLQPMGLEKANKSKSRCGEGATRKPRLRQHCHGDL